MAAHSKMAIGAGVAIAGLGLIGAGAGATFTAQVSGKTSITSGGVGLSLNGETGSDLELGMDGRKIGSHFTPISKDLVLKNTGTLDMASNYLSVTATGCDGSEGSQLAKALHLKLTDETNGDLVYDGDLCSFAGTAGGHDATSTIGQGVTSARAHTGVGSLLPHALGAGKSIHYLFVIQPNDAIEGLPSDAQETHTSVKLVFTGFDY